MLGSQLGVELKPPAWLETLTEFRGVYMGMALVCGVLGVVYMGMAGFMVCRLYACHNGCDFAFLVCWVYACHNSGKTLDTETNRGF